jgi:uncharacterized membrane protein YeaQ/YmgE (transglycosylase-associated protein family)
LEEIMNIIVTLIIGGIIGWLASLIMKTNAQMGILANIVVGIIGGSSASGSRARWTSGHPGPPCSGSSPSSAPSS